MSAAKGIARSASAEHIVDHAHAENGARIVHNGGDGIDDLDSLLPAGGAEDALSRDQGLQAKYLGLAHAE